MGLTERGQEKHSCRGSRPVQSLKASKGLLGHSHGSLHLSKELNFWSCKLSNLDLWGSVMKVVPWIKLSADELLVAPKWEGLCPLQWKEGERKKDGTPFLRKLVLGEGKPYVAPSILSLHMLISEQTLKKYWRVESKQIGMSKDKGPMRSLLRDGLRYPRNRKYFEQWLFSCDPNAPVLTGIIEL